MGFATTNTDNQDTIFANDNKTLALIKWIIDSTNCYRSTEIQEYDGLRAAERDYWRTHDTTMGGTHA